MKELEAEIKKFFKVLPKISIDVNIPEDDFRTVRKVLELKLDDEAKCFNRYNTWSNHHFTGVFSEFFMVKPEKTEKFFEPISFGNAKYFVVSSKTKAELVSSGLATDELKDKVVTFNEMGRTLRTMRKRAERLKKS